jgi:hypothetical protein
MIRVLEDVLRGRVQNGSIGARTLRQWPGRSLYRLSDAACVSKLPWGLRVDVTEKGDLYFPSPFRTHCWYSLWRNRPAYAENALKCWAAGEGRPETR